MRVLLFIIAILWSSFSWADAPFFVKNKGQWSHQAVAKADVPSGAIFLENKAITYHFIDQSQLAHAHDQHEVCEELNSHAIQWRFVNSQKAKIIELIKSNFDLSPSGIKNFLKLDQPIYEVTSTYGHFGRDFNPEKGTFSWESTASKELFKENL